MTVHDWQQHVTSKGIKQNDAVMMLNDAKAEIERLRAALQSVLDADALIGDVDMSMKPEHIRTEKAQRIANFILAKEHARRVLGEATL